MSSTSATPYIIAITGGIGSGKSVVSRLLRTMGYTVFDCDSSAKFVMEADAELRQALLSLFGQDTYLNTAEGLKLNRPFLSAAIFGDASLLEQMNACVHPAVARHLKSVIEQHQAESIIFYESAILFESRFNQLVPPHEVWTVSAPLELRIERAMQRDHCTRQKVLSRIDAQFPQDYKERLSQTVILNDDKHSVLSQVRAALAKHAF